MDTTAERILLVVSDPAIKDLIANQALEPLGYQVQIAGDVNSAITQAAQSAPDLVIADLNLPGLSGKDLLVAMNSQGLRSPVIVIAGHGQENNVIQAFRLGASDYLIWPARDAEVISAVERALRQVRDERSRQRLDQQLKEANQELQRRVRELTTIFAVGKAVISITDQRVLFTKIVEGMVYVAEADFGWLLLRDESSRTFILRSHSNLPEAWAQKMGQSLDDGISSLVALSGETLVISGDPLKRFKVATLGQSAIVIPIKIKQEVIGLLVAVRKANQPFESTMQSLLGALADYASISLVNARLFRALQESLNTVQASEKRKDALLLQLQRELQPLLQGASYPIELLLTGKMDKLTSSQMQAIETAQGSLQRALLMLAASRQPQPDTNKHSDDG